MKRLTIVREHKYEIVLCITILFGVLLRTAFTGSFPANGTVFQDEAYTAYDAWSILHYGKDSSGYSGAVYSAAWGSGQSIMAIYIEIPFIALFGLNAFAVRLPREILGCLGIAAFYFLCKRMRGSRFALVGAMVLSIMPWHIMMSRWGLDCNYLPEFILFAILFLVKGTDDSRFLLLSGLFFGLSLYCYAAAWPVMPLLTGSCVIYLLCKKMIRPDKYFIFGLIILALLALPLLLFVAVNLDFISPVQLPFLTIPKLTFFRSTELIGSIKDLIKNAYRTLQLFVQQDDGRVSDVTPLFGLYYKFSWPFILYGMGCSLYEMMHNKENELDFLIWMELVCSAIMGAVLYVYFSRINLIHFAFTYFLAVGLYELCNKFQGKFQCTVLLLYCGSAIAFMGYYVTEGDEQSAAAYHDGVGYAIDYALSEEQADTTIHVISDIAYPQILFYSHFPTDQYLNTAVFVERQQLAAKIPVSFGEFDVSWWIDRVPGQYAEPESDDIYIALHDDEDAMQYMEKHHMQFAYFDNVVVGVCQ